MWIKSGNVQPSLLTLVGAAGGAAALQLYCRLSQTIFVTAGEPLSALGGGKWGTILCGDGRFKSTEWIPLGITVCDMGLTVIFSAVTPPHERCLCVAARGFNEKYTFQLR